jgi:hypothetical protein
MHRCCTAQSSTVIHTVPPSPLQVLDSLHSLPSLRELDVSHQKLAPGQQLAFDAATMAALAPSLRELAAAGCRASDVAPLACLRNLVKLDLEDNALASLDDVEEGMMGLVQLRELVLRGNPVCRQQRYREQARASMCCAFVW